MSVTFRNFMQEGQAPLDSYFGGIGRSVLGRSTPRANFNRQFIAPNQRVILIDVSFNGLMQVAQNVPHLNTVISRGAEMFSNMIITHVDKNGKEIKNSEILKLLNNPNPLQTLQQFLYDFYVNFAIYSSNFGYKNYGSRLNELPTCVWWLPPGWMKINATGKIYGQYKIEEIIENYTFMFDQTIYEPQDIIHISEGISQSKLTGSSKIEALQFPLSNIISTLKSQNIIINERGMIGFISNKGNKDMSGGTIPMSSKEKEILENQYQKDRSLDSENSHVGIFQSSLEWVPMTFDIKQLMLFEGLEDSFCQICAAYGIDRKIFPSSIVSKSTLGATSDTEQAIKTTIQNTLQPLANKMLSRISNEFHLTDRNERLEASWGHLPVMKEDDKLAQEAFYSKIQGLSILKRDGIIDANTYAEIAEVEMTGTGESEQQINPLIAKQNANAK